MNPSQSISIREQVCLNPLCRGSNILIHSRAKKRLKCGACGTTWSANRGNPYFGFRSAPEKISRAHELLKNGFSVRKIAALVGVHHNTVQRWKKRLANYNYDEFFPPT